MASFKDSKGREWLLAINVLSADLVKKATNVDMYRLLHDQFQPLRELFENICVLANVAFELCHDQRPDVTDKEFAMALDGDALVSLQRGLCAAIVEITPSSKRANVQKLFDRLFELESECTDRVGGFLDRKFDDLIDEAKDVLSDEEDDEDEDDT
jgi:hypothetical protein